jgi:2-keto-4-pentenoate hydratase/2-oxohepta-3-ene-1,7-dioic acid hydratase in catechol pathway
MKIATVRHNGQFAAAVIDEAAQTARLLPGTAGENGGLPAILANPALAEATGGEPLALDTLQLAAPIPRPARNIFCIGKNYAAHAREMAQPGADELPQHPVVFSKLPDCVTGPGEPIQIDAAISTAIDYEAELAVIIGTGGRNIAPEQAMEHVWGYTILNDVTARDIQKRHNQWLLGKSQDSFCPMGPWAVTRDEVNLADTSVRCFINGELRQDGNTADLIFSVPVLIAAISRGITLNPGDIISTGTPAGVGHGFEPPRYLVPGDVVRIAIAGIGALENPVAARQD